jgi:mannose-6-phosphate isomerase
LAHTPLYPLLLKPALHTKVWGGRKLAEVMHKDLPTAEPYGESWEMHDTAVIANGPLANMTMADALAQYGADLIGPGGKAEDGLPLLAKILDAADWLSVQVHPNDDQARQLEGQPRGKTEAWYVLSAEPNAKLVIGVHPGTSRAEIAHAIRGNTLEKMLVYADVQQGDVLFIPAGTIHALGPGLLIYEIQQSSDTTYRLYDWGRMGLDGKPRDLHIDKSLAVSNTDKLPEIRRVQPNGQQTVSVVSSPFFTTLLHNISAERPFTHSGEPRRFHILTCTEGNLTVEAGGQQIALGMGQTAFIPYAVGGFTLSGAGRVLDSFQT